MRHTGNHDHWLALKWTTSHKLNLLRTAADRLMHPCLSPRLILILGCQRSGTTMLAKLIGLSPRVKAYGEGDPKYFHREDVPRLLPIEQVARALSQERNRFVLLKPLCETQRASSLLQRFPAAKVVWAVRHYSGCVTSHIKYYRPLHDGIAYVREMFRTAAPNWKNVGLEGEIVEILEHYADTQFNLPTGYALYWLARNSHYFNLPDKTRVRLVRYESVVGAPAEEAARLFDFLEVPFKQKYARIVTSSPLSDRAAAKIDPYVRDQCELMYQRLCDFLA